MQSVVLDRNSVFIKANEAPKSCGSEEVIVKIHAAALSAYDGGFRYGISRFVRAGKEKPGIGSSFSGEIVSVGSASCRFSPGNEVVGFVLNPYESMTLCTYIVVPESVCCGKPSGVPSAIAVSAVTDFMLAERTLRLAKANESDSILITGGATPLAKTLIELAKSSMFGVEWVATTVNSLEERLYSESIGADETFDTNCNSGKWSQSFSTGANRKEYDIVIDLVGDTKNAKRLVKRTTGRWTCLLNKCTPRELLDFDSRVGGNYTLKLYRKLLSSPWVGNLLLGCSGRAKTAKYFSVIPSGDGEILERLFVLMETGAVTSSLERVVALKDVLEAVSSLRSDPFAPRGRMVVELQVD